MVMSSPNEMGRGLPGIALFGIVTPATTGHRHGKAGEKASGAVGRLLACLWQGSPNLAF